MRAVLDPNVLISAVISPAGAPREILTAWTQGRFELIVSPLLLDELRDVLSRPRLRRWVSEAVAAAYVEGLQMPGRSSMTLRPSPGSHATPTTTT